MKLRLFLSCLNQGGDVRWPLQVICDADSDEPQTVHLLHLSIFFLKSLISSLVLLTLSSRFSVHQSASLLISS